MAASDRWERNAGGRNRAAAESARRVNRQHELSQRIQQVHQEYQDEREKMRELALRKRELLGEVHEVQEAVAAAAKASDHARNEARAREKKLEREIDQREAQEARVDSRVKQLREELDKVRGPGAAQQYEAERSAAQFDLEEEIVKERNEQQVIATKLDELTARSRGGTPPKGRPYERLRPSPGRGDGTESPYPSPHLHVAAVMPPGYALGYAPHITAAYPTLPASFAPPSIPPAYTPVGASPVPTARSGMPMSSTRIASTVSLGPSPRAEIVRYVSPPIAPMMMMPGQYMYAGM